MERYFTVLCAKNVFFVTVPNRQKEIIFLNMRSNSGFEALKIFLRKHYFSFSMAIFYLLMH